MDIIYTETLDMFQLESTTSIMKVPDYIMPMKAYYIYSDMRVRAHTHAHTIWVAIEFHSPVSKEFSDKVVQ